MNERTTVRLPPALLDRAKRKAAADGRTLTALIEEGLRLVLAQGSKHKKKPVLPRISKATGGPCQVSISPVFLRWKNWMISTTSSA